VRASPPANDGRKPSSGLRPEEERAILQGTIDRHYHAVLDQPVPMLGDLRPRKTAKTKKGREKLVAWLKFIENSDAQQDPDSYDFGSMWEELGIAHLRL
jgi:hypothetical protein